jgi:phosphogluconate dehydratase
MSGASGKVPAAIHVTPEASRGGMLARVRDGDRVRVDGDRGRLELLVDAAELARRAPVHNDSKDHQWGCGRELFAGMRQLVSGAEEGACTLFSASDHSINEGENAK